MGQVLPGRAFRREAFVWIALGDNLDDHRRLLGQIDDPAQRRDALWAASFCGRGIAVEAALPCLEDETFGPLAAEVICGIAGLPTDDESLWQAPSELSGHDEELPDLAADLAADLALDPERLLPMPNGLAVREWWRARGSSLDPGVRWLGGETLGDESLIHALINTPLRRRHVLGLLGQRRSGALVWVDTRTWATAQLRGLGG